MALSVWPLSVVLDAEGCTEKVTLVNCGQTDLVIKIKTSNITDYTFKPVHTIIKSGATKYVEIVRKKAPPKRDRFVLVYAPLPPKATDAQSAFNAAASTIIGQITVQLHAIP
ncbi:hypothetical protein Q1695_013759 [Nippostrongylus brasiliensis]|nr:hypothetical protein Q1695_013759 [Nippostrongylus brasiliensis]